ncbi:hypothetical protein [Rhizobium laguerreae]|uniref:hypothetical protein n=1 Tax=Rhizobium laguerreae TaxID=1076926 RepID=UPI001C915CC1|nr:hypothetical protein [Rhizobium laguerreae]MBY3559775.1 hypothetical protein [Rhizobium laguerreae]
MLGQTSDISDKKIVERARACASLEDELVTIDLRDIAPGMVDDTLSLKIDRSIPPIGTGTSRIVYALRDHPELVVKEMKHPFPMSNMVEWLVWNALVKMAEDHLNAVTNVHLQTMFARSYAISQTGRFLVTERLSALDDSDKFDRGSFPSWLNDVKPAAFGRDTSFGKDAVGRIKVMDYAEINFFDVLNPLNKTISL